LGHFFHGKINVFVFLWKFALGNMLCDFLKSSPGRPAVPQLLAQVWLARKARLVMCVSVEGVWHGGARGAARMRVCVFLYVYLCCYSTECKANFRKVLFRQLPITPEQSCQIFLGTIYQIPIYLITT
jgi:hypothetical protein